MRTSMSGPVRALITLTIVILPLAVAAETMAQTPFAPYYGKARVKYDNFQWQIYTTDHFEIYYYPEIEKHLERVAGYAESAYQHVSTNLKHDLAAKVPLVLFKTHSEFEQQNVIPGDVPEGVAAFAEPQRNRMVLPIDEPPDRLYGLITHELTHIFEFDIIPRALTGRGIPLWVDEGLADYMRGDWTPLDLMTVRDAALADIVPRMSQFEGYGEFNNPRLTYNLGHAAFEFIEARWGIEGIRKFLFALRKSVIGGGASAYEEAFTLQPEDFDDQFAKYMTDRFKPFRDKQRPQDYGKNLAPNGSTSKFRSVVSIEPSPSGDLMALVTVNPRDQELDIVLVSSTDGKVIRNLTSGFDQDRGYEYIVHPGGRSSTVPWLSWSPVGDTLAYFVRAGKQRTLILQNVLSRKIEQRIELKTVDEPESPDVAPNGRAVAFAALQGAVWDIFTVNLDTREVTNLTDDASADFAPIFSPDGRYLVYLARVSGNTKLVRLDLDTRKKTQLTFGANDEAAAQFLDGETLVFSSTATDPTRSLDPEIARNGNIYNLWTLELGSGELGQLTDTLGANLSPVALRAGDATRVAFLSYFKGEFGLHKLSRTEPILTAASSDFGEPAPAIDFQTPLAHTLVTGNSRKKGAFEKLFLEGRPPLNVGVTNSGDLFGGTQLTFTDVLGERQVNIAASSVSQYRTFAFSYVNQARRFQYAAQGFSQTQFFYGLQPGRLFDAGFGFLDRDEAEATRTSRGGTVFGIYPLDRYRRLEVSGGIVQVREQFNNPALEFEAQQFQAARFGTQLFRNGTTLPLGVTFVQETTIFREFGPLSGNTVRLGYDVSPGIGGTLSRQTLDVDARYYQRLGATGVLALRARGFASGGDSPDFLFFGGNSELRGYRYLEFIGQKAFFANAEIRFPLIDAALTPIGVIGGIRGVFFANLGAGGLNGQPFSVYKTNAEVVRPTLDFACGRVTCEPVLGDPQVVSGFRLVDGRATYGVGLQTFALGFPVHLDISWRTLLNKQWEDVVFARSGGSAAFRRPRFDVWIGFDF